MSKFLNSKVLTFYGGSVIGVVTLFSIATSYGETKLQAPRRIDGRYPLSAPNLSGCLKAKQLVLQIHQSGKYLTGAILPADATEKMFRIAEERPSLMGLWHQPRLTLEGSNRFLASCQDTVAIQGEMTEAPRSQQPASGEPIAGSLIYGNYIVSGAVILAQEEGTQNILNGELRLGSASGNIPFSAKREVPPIKTQEH